MKYRTIGVTAALGLCLLTTACTEETKEQLEDTVITIEFGDGKTDATADNGESERLFAV
jgi:hypothetical protein